MTRLALTDLRLSPRDVGRPELTLRFQVSHSSSALRTTLEGALSAVIDENTGRVTASLELAELHAASLDEARDRMAVWCDRMAATLRGVARVPADVPKYERRCFDPSALPAWLQREYAVLAERFKRCALAEATECAEDICDEMRAQDHPLLLIYGAYDMLQSLGDATE